MGDRQRTVEMSFREMSKTLLLLAPKAFQCQDLNSNFLTSTMDLEMSDKSQGSAIMLPETVTFQHQS